MSPARKIRGSRTMGEILGAGTFPQVPAEVVYKRPVAPIATQKVLTYALTKPRSIEGYITLTQLAAERGMQAQLARLWVKRAGVRKPAEGWRWLPKSSALKRVRKVLELS